jgi:hypothetical protein
LAASWCCARLSLFSCELIDSTGGVSWTRSQYKLEFTADQLASLKNQVQPNLISEKLDVTKFVRSGQLIVG